MFLPYSVDVAYDHRPWAGYVVFFASIVLSFFLIFEERQVPDHSSLRIYGWMLCGVWPLLFLIYFVSSLFFLWVFGNAVCSKTGNVIYVILFVISILLPLLINDFVRDPIVWYLSCIVSIMLGLYIAIWPTNIVDCIFIIPPWTDFSTSGFWVLLWWFFLDLVFSAISGWEWGLIIHPVFILVGLITAVLMETFKAITIQDDERSLLQMIKGEEVIDKSWEDSFSARKKKTTPEDSDDIFKDVVTKDDANRNLAGDYIHILCQCGNIVEIPASAEEGTRYICPKCSHKVTVPPAP